MRVRPLFWSVVCLLCLTGAWFFWQQGNRWSAEKPSAAGSVAPSVSVPAGTSNAVSGASSSGQKNSGTNTLAATATNAFPYRLSNTQRTVSELAGDRRAILLENAFIDTRLPLNLSIPKNLQAQGDPGAYIVQARGSLNEAFRGMLMAAGAQVVSYIPNNAYLVRVTSGKAAGLSANGLVAAVIPYEPYYKVQSSLLAHAEEALPKGGELNLGLFGNNATQTIGEIEKLGGQILSQDVSPFGPVVRVTPPRNWTALAQLTGVQLVELAHRRVQANDLSRARLGVAADSQVATNYLGLTGTNVWVMVNDSGVDATHPDLVGRVFGTFTNDVEGHGTHVAGIIAGDGAESLTVTNAQGSIMPATNGQFRGMAPAAKLVTLDVNLSDRTLQETAAQTNALISNNSWVYDGDTTYDLNAASYDAAVRDALPQVTGSQPVLFVFAAGNSGGGNNSGGGGDPDTVLSPATAKNVITVGALESLRYITNTVTNADSSVSAPWQEQSDTDFQVAGFSSRGNVGIGTEGTYGRYKPDVIAPGTFVVSTRASMWDTNTFFNPTNVAVNTYQSQIIQPDNLNYYNVSVPPNAVGVNIRIIANSNSPVPFPTNDLPIYVQQSDFPDPVNFPADIDITTTNGQVLIPNPDGGDTFLTSIQNGGFYFAVGDSTNIPVNYNLVTEILTTNDMGNYYEVLHAMDDNDLGHYYRYESGTSMSAADISGVLALMQDYFTNTLKLTPSPALLKALLINGARAVGNYDFQAANSINFQGWGLANLPTSIQPDLTNAVGAASSMFFVDQSPTNALATGDSRTYHVTLTDDGTFLPLRVTLAWTDPAGNPAAALKLVNNLDLVVTNLDDPTNPIVYVGNDIPASSIYNSAWDTNSSPTPNWDTVNNIENVFLSPMLGTNYTVTVIARNVNVNAVTAHTNNYVQDYALVISSGDSEVTNAFTVTTVDAASNTVPQITYVLTNGVPILNQFAGANTPLLGTNAFNPDSQTNKQITIGMTNQWHFYVVTNNTGYTNAAFITFIPDTASLPRMGVFADSDDNSTRPEADIDLYVSTVPSLTNLAFDVVSNCAVGPQVTATVGGILYAASLGRGGTEFVADSNSQPNQVYYIGVKSEDNEASQYGFLPVFSEQPFSQLNPDGSQTVNGLTLPVNIPDGSPAHPGLAYVFALALYPMEVGNVTVANSFVHQNFGDLVGVLSHNGETSVLNNHRSLGNPPGPYGFVYDDQTYPTTGSQTSDGPGSLRNFVSKEAIGPWILTEVDNALTQTGSVTSFSLLVQPHTDLTKDLLAVSLEPQSWFYTYIDVPPGATNLTVTLTNTNTPPAPVQMYIRYGAEPDSTDYDKTITVSNGVPFWNGSLSVGLGDVPPLRPGRYYIGLYNISATSVQTVLLKAQLDFGAASSLDFSSTGSTPLLDDAVTYSYINITNTDLIYSLNVGLRVDHPRISDLVFHLISPNGTRYLLMENRGGTSTNGIGASYFATNETVMSDGFDNAISGGVFSGAYVDGWLVSSGSVDVCTSGYGFLAASADSPPNCLELNGNSVGTIVTNFNTVVGRQYVLSFAYTKNPSPGAPNYPHFVASAGVDVNNQPLLRWSTPPTLTNSYDYLNWLQTSVVFTATSPVTTLQFEGLDTGPNFGMFLDTVRVTGPVTNYYYLTFTEDTNLTTVPIKYAVPPFVSTNIYIQPIPSVPTNVSVLAGPVLNTNNGHYYYLLQTNNWTVSEAQAVLLGGHLTTINDAAENNWVASQFMSYGGTNRDLWIGMRDTANDTTTVVAQHATNFFWVSGDTSTYRNWASGEPNNGGGIVYEYYGFIDYFYGGKWNDGPDVAQISGKTEPQNGVVEVVPSLVRSNLYYLPEESLGGVKGQSAQGTWTLEIWDNRAGATNVAPNLLSWNLDFTFATGGNPTIPNLPDGGPVNNFIGAGGIAYYRVDVPANAHYATNILSNATGPLNIFWTTNVPPSITNTTDVLLMPSATSGSITLGTNGSPINTTSAFIVPGATYYLGVQNTNSTTVNYTIEVDFDSTIFPPTFSGIGDTNIDEGFLLTVTNTATNPYGDPMTYQVFSSTGLPAPSIDANGIITWTPIEVQGPGIYSIQTIVTDTVTLLAATNIFNVTVNEVNDYPPVFTDLTLTTNRIFITDILVPFTVTNSAVDGGDNWLTNISYSLINPPPGMTIDTTSGVIYWLPGVAVSGTTNPIITVATDDGSPKKSATNAFIVVVNAAGTIIPPFSATLPATGVTGTNATLNGFSTPNGFASTAWFEWGTSRYYDHRSALFNVGSGTNVVYLTNSITGLLTNEIYHFRLVTSNNLATAYGFDRMLGVGTVLAWGRGDNGQTNVPLDLTNAVMVSGNYASSLALRNDGTVAAWGDNSMGQTNIPAGLSNVIQIASGYAHNLALKSDHTVVAWGYNASGQTNVPVGLTDVVAIAGGAGQSLALKSDGTVVAWGENGLGQTNVPVGLSNIVAISGEIDSSCALRNDGTVLIWGYITPVETNVPPQATNIVMLSSLGDLQVALRDDGVPIAWGTSVSGASDVPANLTNAVATAAGYHFGLVLNDDYTPAAWGENTFNETNIPASFTNLFAIGAGGQHELFIQSTLDHPIIVPGITSVTSGTNGITLQWNAPVYEAFQVQWTTNLMPVIVWNTFPNTVTSTNGVFTFVDDGSQSGGLGGMKFYRLILLP